METLSQNPQATVVQFAKMNAMQNVFDTIETLAGLETGNQERLVVIEKLLAEKPDYRTEQSLRKLQEYFQLERDLEIRAGEIERILPGALTQLKKIGGHTTQPDEKYLVH